MEQKKEICICAAVRTQDEQIIAGWRHGDCFYTLHKNNLKEAEQGFLTSEGRFVSRNEGRKLQDEAGIKSASYEGYIGNTLFSEDLY